MADGILGRDSETGLWTIEPNLVHHPPWTREQHPNLFPAVQVALRLTHEGSPSRDRAELALSFVEGKHRRPVPQARDRIKAAQEILDSAPKFVVCGLEDERPIDEISYQNYRPCSRTIEDAINVLLLGTRHEDQGLGYAQKQIKLYSGKTSKVKIAFPLGQCLFCNAHGVPRRGPVPCYRCHLRPREQEQAQQRRDDIADIDADRLLGRTLARGT